MATRKVKPLENGRLPDGESPPRPDRSMIWRGLVRMAARTGLVFAVLILVLLVAERLAEKAPDAAADSTDHQAVSSESVSETVLPATVAQTSAMGGGFTLERQASPHTIIPDRPAQTISLYTVQGGDSVFGIAEGFGLRPETIFWANAEILQDSVHLLYPGQELRIPPVDGVVHRITERDTVESIGLIYGVDASAITELGYNPVRENADLVVGELIIVPGGEREMVAWRPPVVVGGTDTYAYGGNSGACAGSYVGYGGTGIFIYPTDRHYLSGYQYGLGHGGIDLATNLGDPLYAADGGVVVYSGWNTWGYGNLTIIDHGNGYQTFYAHQSAIYYGCGAYVERGTVIGAAGSTGRSTGPHLHFEIRYNWVPVNPWGYLS